jgi:hypothetical protein
MIPSPERVRSRNDIKVADIKLEVLKNKEPRPGVLPTEAPGKEGRTTRAGDFVQPAAITSAISGVRMGHFGPHGGAETMF